MQKQELITKVHALQKTTVTKKLVESIIDAYTSILEDELVNRGDITIGTICGLKVVNRAERTCRNPNTGGSIVVPARKGVKLRLTKNLKERLK